MDWRIDLRSRKKGTLRGAGGMAVIGGEEAKKGAANWVVSPGGAAKKKNSRRGCS